MTDLIKSYEQQFGNLTAEATAKISELTRVAREGAPGDEVDGVKRQVQDALSEAREVLEQYELEVREQPQTERQKLTWRLKSYKTEYQRLEKELRSTSDKLQELQSRKELLGATIDVSLTNDANMEEQNLLVSERIERGTNRLREAQRVAIESEEIGVDILTNLARDRETINRSRARVRDTEMNLNTSSRLLSSMMRRAVQNRIILFGIMAALFLFIIAMIYMKLS